ncbi:MAG: HRDC domain-containing protein [Coraliomargaritaceae bacterium]
MSNISEEIYYDIRSWRALEAEKLGRAPFYIFKDEVIGNFLRKIDKIKCKEDILEEVEGIGKTIYQKYGDELWNILRPYLLKLDFIDIDPTEENVSVSQPFNKTHQNPEEGEARSILLEELKKLRKSLAEERKLPSYCIFHNTSLLEMSKMCPTTDEAFLKISGCGPAKLKSYGHYFMEIISKFLSEDIKISPTSETEWSKEDLLYLKELLITESSLGEIAQEMCRTEQSIRLKISDIVEKLSKKL